MAWRGTWFKVKEPVTGFVGAGVGLSISELLAEFTARTTGQMGWKKAGVKTLVKLVLAALFIGISAKVRGAWVLFTKVAAWAGLGSIVPDWIFYFYPGGIPGLAERMAVSVRTWAMGAEKVRREIERVGKYTESPGRGQPASPKATVGRYS